MSGPSAARRGLDLLLAQHPGFEVLSAEWQPNGPWLLIELGLEGHAPNIFARYPWAIWKNTGAVHGMQNGAVSDDPLWVP